MMDRSDHVVWRCGRFPYALGRVVVSGTYTDPVTKSTQAYVRQFCTQPAE